MTLFLFELKRSKLSLFVWTIAIGFMLSVTVLIYPQMAIQMDDMTKAFSEMGAFTSAFGMDKLNFGEITDYFCIECMNVLGLGGAIFAALAGAGSLSKEESEKTSEFLFSHPVSRAYIASSKLAATLAKVAILNAGAALFSLVSFLAVGENVNVKTIVLVFAAALVMHVEIAGICFGVSAFAVRGSAGIGIGIAFGSYLLNILSNLTDKLKALKYLTPFSYAEGSGIKASGGLDGKYIAAGAALFLLCVCAAFLRYRKKDL